MVSVTVFVLPGDLFCSAEALYGLLESLVVTLSDVVCKVLQVGPGLVNEELLLGPGHPEQLPLEVLHVPFQDRVRSPLFAHCLFAPFSIIFLVDSIIV